MCASLLKIMDLLGITSKTFFFISLIPFLYIQSNALANITYIDHDCTTGTYASYDEDSQSINSLLSELTHHSSNSTFYSSKSGSGENTTYGYFYCTANVNTQDCHSCVQTAANASQSYCESYKAAVVFYRECTLHYSDSPLYGISDETIYSWDETTFPVSYKQFNNTLYSSLENVITQAAEDPKGFATSGARLVGTKQRLYTFAQCTPDILGTACQSCLRVALDQFQGCCTGSRFGPLRAYLRILLMNCQLAHEVRNPSSNNGIIPSSLSESSSSESSSVSPPGLMIWNVMVALAAAAIALHLAFFGN